MSSLAGMAIGSGRYGWDECEVSRLAGMAIGSGRYGWDECEVSSLAGMAIGSERYGWDESYRAVSTNTNAPEFMQLLTGKAA